MVDIILSKYKPPQKDSDWNYDSSVSKMKELVLTWKNISIEILDELYITKKNLKSQGVRNDLLDDEQKGGWENYLIEVGLSKETVRRWLKQYNPEMKIILPKEIESSGKLKTNHKCPNCNYEW